MCFWTHSVSVWMRNLQSPFYNIKIGRCFIEADFIFIFDSEHVAVALRWISLC